MGKLNNLHSFTASVARGGRGYIVWRPALRQPEKVLELYEFESCPFCRKVRDVLSELDLCYVSHPCPRGSVNRKKVVELGGKSQYPFLVDPNTGRQMYESEDIIGYLCETYGRKRSFAARALSVVNTTSAAIASAIRPRGGHARSEAAGKREQPAQLLELYNFEASPYCRKVREALCELNLDYKVNNVAKRSARRPQLVARGGKMMVPYLIDPNTGIEMYESDDIIAYLQQTYS